MATASSSSSLLVVLNMCLVLFGAGSGLLLRVYFVHGGKRTFLPAFLQMCGWPLLLPPICVSLCRRSSQSHDHGHVGGLANLLLPPSLAVAVAVLGVQNGTYTLLYTLGSQALPLSTSSLLSAAQLAFTAVAAFFTVGLRFTPFSANAVVLLTIGPTVLGVGSSAASMTKPAGEAEASSTYWWIGFSETIAAAALAGLVLPLMELAMARYGRPTRSSTSPYAVVMQVQTVMAAVGTALCLVGMAINGDFQAVPSEAATFGLGKTSYYLVLSGIAVSSQLLNLGLTGLVVYASSLLAGIASAALVPLLEILAVIFLHEKFDGHKGIALVLALWGFASYFYGEKQQAQNKISMEAQNNHHTTGDLDTRLLQIHENHPSPTMS